MIEQDMKRSQSSHSQRDDKFRSSRNEDSEVASCSRTEEEKLRRRREWMIQQEREREHERLKKKMILEYEMKRAREKDLAQSKEKLSHHGSSCSRSKSPQHQLGRNSASDKPKTLTLYEKLEPSNGSTPLFKGPEGTKISITELRKIKVDIHRNIPGKSTSDDLQRDIIDPEDVVLKRREGEGSKPIFEREEIKNALNKTEEIGERRTVIAISSENLEDSQKTLKNYVESSSRVKARSHSPRRTSPHHYRREDPKRESKESYRSDRRRDRSRSKSREHEECCTKKERRHSHRHSMEKERSRETSRRRDHSRSREREQRKRDKDFYYRSYKDDRPYEECRGRSRERSRERRERDRSRELRVPPPHYVEQIPIPIYCGNFPPRPIMVGPLVSLRGQVPFGNVRHPSMIGSLRPFPPQFIPPEMYRLRPPSNPRFGPRY